MCLAIPAQVISVDSESDRATVSIGKVQQDVSLALVEDVTEGDFVLVHVGYALNTISAEEAQKTLALIAEAGLAADALSDENGSP